jgi:hypothetical protein
LEIAIGIVLIGDRFAAAPFGLTSDQLARNLSSDDVDDRVKEILDAIARRGPFATPSPQVLVITLANEAGADNHA